MFGKTCLCVCLSVAILANYWAYQTIKFCAQLGLFDEEPLVVAVTQKL